MLHCPKCGRHYATEVGICPVDQTPLQADPTVAENPPIDPLLGHILDDKYRIEEQLGIGGMGTVYRARHQLIDRLVAIKVLNPRFVEDEAARTRFRREAKAAGRLQHPNAVAVTDFGQTPDGYVYIVMELLVGRTLREVLAKEAPLDIARAVSITLQVSAAVGAAHQAGIIHRDLKPANIFIVQSSDVPSTVKVLDFGIAKLAAETLDDDDPTLTIVGAMIGTPRYMSPEQCSGIELTPAADVYSLGVILYEMLTGVLPFTGSTPLAIALKHATDPPLDPRQIVSTIPEPLAKLVLAALEKAPEDRPANATEFQRQLLEVAGQLGLEHAATTSSPNLDALKDIGTESPSGRLVIDLARLRENVAANSLGDVTVVRNGQANQGSDPVVQAKRERFPRVAVPLVTRRPGRAIVLFSALGAVMLAGILFFALHFAGPAPATSVSAQGTPLPVATVTPSPSPSPSPSPARAAKKPSNNNNKKKKDDSILKKAGRFLTKPF